MLTDFILCSQSLLTYCSTFYLPIYCFLYFQSNFIQPIDSLFNTSFLIMLKSNLDKFMLIKEIFIDHIIADIQQRYQFNSHCLGEGGFGQVFRAKSKNKLVGSISTLLPTKVSSKKQGDENQEKSHGQERAIKKLLMKNPQDKQLMKNEMEILSYLDHPLILRLYQTFEHKKEFYLVTDLLKGGDLLSYVNEKGPMKEKEAKVIFQQLINALCYLHSQHICHRDIKLQNILLLDSSSLDINLVDFGLAFCWDEDMKKELEQQNGNRRMTGTPDYMSPQMVELIYDQRCDIWAAGVILYILLSGTTPFSGSNDRQIMKKIKKIDYNFQDEDFQKVSEEAKNLIEKIFKHEDQRISLRQILDDPWLNQKRKQCSQNGDNQTNNSISSLKKLKREFSDTKPKLQTTKSFSKFDDESRSCFTEDYVRGTRPEQLTVAKIQHFIRLPKLLKFISIYSVSKLSEGQIKIYGAEYLKMDKDNDGMISQQDLVEWLRRNQNYEEQEKTKLFFNRLVLSQRGYISYTEYLACVLSYEFFEMTLNELNNLEPEQNSFKTESSKLVSKIFHAQTPIKIFDKQRLYQLFCFLDRNSDGFVSYKNFYQLFQKCGVRQGNESFLQEIKQKLKGFEPKGKQVREGWSQDFREYNEYLTRTYKGQKDGGPMISFQVFKEMINEQIKSSHQIMH